MSDTPIEGEEPEQKKKKGGKLPIIIALVAVLAGGGFFMMKGKGKAEPPPIKLGAIEPLEEFLVNLGGSSTYLRTEIALHLKEKFTKEDLDKSLAAVRDAVVTVLRSKSAQDIGGSEGMATLKKELVEAINKVLEAAEAAAHPPEAAPEKKEEAKGVKPKVGTPRVGTPKVGTPKLGGELKGTHLGVGAPGTAKDKAPAHPDWDSQTGPVLKLYFTSFATM